MTDSTPPLPDADERAWLPIESAPKDGTRIIGAFWAIRWADSHRIGDVVTCWWQPEFEAFISDARVMMLAARSFCSLCGSL